MGNSDAPLLIAFVGDLFFTPQIESAARLRGFRLQLVEHADQIAPPIPDPPRLNPGEPLHGRLGALIHRLASEHPALLIFDLNNENVPWTDWIAVIKSSPATRRIPVVCFGSHTDVETTARAKQAGADVVLARSRFVQGLPDLIQKYARLTNDEALSEACAASLSPKALQGIEMFNTGAYFEAHEELEAAWNEDTSEARELYRVILQVAVAYMQIERRNYNGAAKMFLRVQQWISPLPDRCRGVDVAQLRADAAQVRRKLEELGPTGLVDFDHSLFKPVYIHSS